MSAAFDEQFQRFTFDESWKVFCYDSAESGYHAICESVSGTKSCDFLGVFSSEAAYFIEVKDFRGYRIQNKPRLKLGELALEVAQKVRDTIAGIVSGVRRRDASRPWVDLAKLLTSPGRQVGVVLCLEDDTAKNPLKWKQELDTQAKLIKDKLDWLDVRVWVVSQSVNPHRLPGVTVSNRPRAASHHP